MIKNEKEHRNKLNTYVSHINKIYSSLVRESHECLDIYPAPDNWEQKTINSWLSWLKLHFSLYSEWKGSWSRISIKDTIYGEYDFCISLSISEKDLDGLGITKETFIIN